MNDKEIVQKFFERDEDAIAEAESRYGNYCRYIAHNVLFNFEDVEECLNDVMLAAWNSIPPQKPSDLKTYLGKLTRDISLDRWRKNKAIKRGSKNTIVSLDELGEMIGSNEVEASVEVSELSRHISIFLRAAKEERRNVFIRRYWYRDTVESICKRYGFKKSKVLMMLKRTRDDLAEYLKKEGFIV